LNAEGRDPDFVYQIHIPDSLQWMAESAAASERNIPRWNWLPTSPKQTNCTVAAIRVLGDVGINALSDWAAEPYTPGNVNDALLNLSGQRNSGVRRLNNVPWKTH